MRPADGTRVWRKYTRRFNRGRPRSRQVRTQHAATLDLARIVIDAMHEAEQRRLGATIRPAHIENHRGSARNV